jgi:hypothetical protein
MRLNDRPVRFLDLDTRWLADRATYDERFRRLVAAAPGVTLDALLTRPSATRDHECESEDDRWPPLEPRSSDVRVEYADLDDYAIHCEALGLLGDVRSGIPRSSYMGVVVFHHGASRVFLAPRSLTRGRDGSRDPACPSTDVPCRAP